jgi:hypothetical protein
MAAMWAWSICLGALSIQDAKSSAYDLDLTLEGELLQRLLEGEPADAVDLV